MVRRCSHTVYAHPVGLWAECSSGENVPPLSQYEYAYIAPTGSVFGSFGGYSQANLNSVNPRDFIAGQLFKRGIIVVPEINPAQAQKTLVVSYGEGDKRNILVGYALEVTIQLTTADMNKLVAVATAEGYGETESDKIRDAISQAMTALFEPEKINESSSPFFPRTLLLSILGNPSVLRIRRTTSGVAAAYSGSRYN